MLHTLTVEIPEMLTPRNVLENVITGGGLVISFVLLSIVNLLRPGFYFTTTQLILKIEGTRSLMKEHLPVFRRESWLLYINYALCVFVLGALITNKQVVVGTSLGNLSLFFLLLNIWHFFALWLVALFSGNFRKFVLPTYLKSAGILWLGIAYFIVGVLWFFIKGIDTVFFGVIVSLSLSELILRWVKGIYSSLRSSVPWYYIILYLCTLEILPIVVFLSIVRGM